MKKYILLFLISIVFGCSSSNYTTSNQAITGNIQYNKEYEGGAAPPQELLDELAIYKFSSNETYYVRTGINNIPFTPIYTTFTTDLNGNFKVKLPIGNYCVMTQKRYLYEQSLNSTTDCQWINSSDFNLNVTSTNQPQEIIFTDTRNNCLLVP
ncbi:hypothetical protein [Flavobacterium sp.]|uniref:hypothetical protein n=1 Tax=Flavobacterium sp. TaxID=239 RepID=UPI00375091BC